MRHTLIEITKVDSLFEAHAIRGFLESHDIQCFIANEYHAGIAWDLRYALGDMRLNVLEKDYNIAKALLQETKHTQAQEPIKVQPISNWVTSFLWTLLSGVPTPIKHRNNK